MTIDVGQPAPDFALKDQHGQTVRLSDFRGGKHVVLVFYPFAFSGICTGELCELRDNLDAFAQDGTQVLAVSCDPMFSLRAFAETKPVQVDASGECEDDWSFEAEYLR